MSQVRLFKITGELRKGGDKLPFTKNIRAVKKEDALQHLYSDMGSRHKARSFEITVEDSIKDLNMRATDLDKARINVTQQLNQIINQTEDYRARLEDLARRKGGGPVELV